MIEREKIRGIDRMIMEGKTDEEIISQLDVNGEDVKTERWIMDVFKKNKCKSNG